MTTWQTLFPFLISAIYIAELIFMTYMGMKEAPGPAACAIVPLVVTILVHLFVINRGIVGPLKNLSLEKASELDITNGELKVDQDYTIDDQLYGQPALKAATEEREPLPYRRGEDSAANKLEQGSAEKQDSEEYDEA